MRSRTPRRAEQLMQRELARFQPDIVRMRKNPNVVGVLGRPSKIFAAFGAIRDVLWRGLLKPGQPLLEVSSGTQALCLANWCNLLGMELYLVVDKWSSPSLIFQMMELGAHVVFSEDDPSLGSQANRLRVAREVKRATGGYFLNQYDTSSHAAGYYPLALHLVEQGLDPDVMVFPVGSGASSRGLLEIMRLLKPEIFGVGIDVLGSVPFGQLDRPRLRTIGGIGNSILPRAVQHNLFDAMHFVSGQFARATTRALLRNEGLWRGESTGPCAHVAAYYGRISPKSQVLFLSPDDGARYQNTAWNPDLPKDAVLPPGEIPSVPVQITYPSDSDGHWCWIDWGRRTYEEVMGHSPDRALLQRLEEVCEEAS